MPRYRFELNECGVITNDARGHVVRDLDAARTTAIEAARGIMAEEVKRGHLCLGCRIDIVDLEGEVVMVVPFREALEIMDPARC